MSVIRDVLGRARARWHRRWPQDPEDTRTLGLRLPRQEPSRDDVLVPGLRNAEAVMHEIERDLAADMAAILIREIENYLAKHAEFARRYPDAAH